MRLGFGWGIGILASGIVGLVITFLSAIDWANVNADGLGEWVRYLGLKLSESSYNSVGRDAPQKMAEKIAERENITMQTYQERADKRKTKKPTIVDKGYSIATGVTGQALQIAATGIDISGDIFENMVLILVCVVVILVLMYLSK